MHDRQRKYDAPRTALRRRVCGAHTGHVMLNSIMHVLDNAMRALNACRPPAARACAVACRARLT